MTTTPALDHFVDNYVNEDWASLFGTVWDALDTYVRESPVQSRSLPEDIDRLLRRCPGEGQVAAYLDGLGIGYQPTPDEGGYRGWLTGVAGRVRAHHQN